MRDPFEITFQSLARIERKLDLIMQHLEINDDVPPEHDRMVEIRSLIRHGRKIEAIKLYRQITRATLLDAKEAVELIEAGL
ncbi:hypothetical protein [Glycomyces harbinensis]|uniref:Ribosomal protein L7/L12 C-terminal domain-containing protein n=1 Tax=Glycomyces harbinensis TaxID=58114 RepID=A0A1G6TPV1_9ACTN|nr:hypothetical protein [Glycomyces harbinensis]SDD30506.1 hypothetical protein SAMN05216270_10363 [Glycomyces harbinensis]